MAGRLEIVRSHVPKKDLRIAVATVEALAKRVFCAPDEAPSGALPLGPIELTGIAALPAAIGQFGLGSDRTQVTPQLANAAGVFLKAVQEFLDRKLPPTGWIAVMGGRMGFAVRQRARAAIVLRATSGNGHVPVSSRKSCVLLLYKAPSAHMDPVGALAQRRDMYLGCLKSTTMGDGCQDDRFEMPSVNILTLEIAPKQCRVLGLSGTRSDSPDKVTVCPLVTETWGFLDLSAQQQREVLMKVFRNAGNQYDSERSDNPQRLAEILKEELTCASGPLWHVFVGREDVQWKSGVRPVVELIADWTMASQSPTKGQLRVVAVQLWGTQPSGFLEKLFAPLLAGTTLVLCFLWMFRSRLCSEGRSRSSFQSALANRLCGARLEIPTALIVGLLFVIVMLKTFHKLR